MIITCPECATRCVVDRTAIGPDGRRVTCGACGAEWFQTPHAATIDGGSVGAERYDDAATGHRRLPAPSRRHGAALPATTGMRRPAPPSALFEPDPTAYGFDARAAAGVRGDYDPAPRPVAGWLKAAGGFVAVVIAGAIGAIATTAFVTGKGPSFDTAAVVDAIVAPFSPAAAVAGAPAGVVFVAHGFDLVERPEGPALEIWGRVANNGPDDAYAPLIEIVSRDHADAELQRWTTRAEAPVLAAGESARFSSRMMHPIGPVNAVDLALKAR